MVHALNWAVPQGRTQILLDHDNGFADPLPVPVQFPDWVRDRTVVDHLFRKSVYPTGRLALNMHGMRMVEVRDVSGNRYFALLGELGPISGNVRRSA